MSATTVPTTARGFGRPPERSLRQRMEALDRANAIRSHRAVVKRDLKAGRANVAEVLADEMFATATVHAVLLQLPRTGRVKASAVLNRCRISPTKTCAGLTDRQRVELAAALAARGLR